MAIFKKFFSTVFWMFFLGLLFSIFIMTTPFLLVFFILILGMIVFYLIVNYLTGNLK